MNLPLEISDLKKSYGRKKVLRRVDLTCSPGSITAVLGPNGSGKSTLIRCILGLNIPDSGSVEVFGANAVGQSGYRRHIGYMPQHPSFPENLTVAEILHLVERVRGRKADSSLCSVLEVDGFFGQRWKTLSGGMKQRVNAFIALVFDAPLLVFDEPTASLDPASRLKFMDLIRREKARGKTLLISTHLLDDIRETADHLLFLNNGNAVNIPREKLSETASSPEAFDRAVANLLENGGAA